VRRLHDAAQEAGILSKLFEEAIQSGAARCPPASGERRSVFPEGMGPRVACR